MDDDCKGLVMNQGKAWRKWARMTKLMSRDVADEQTLGQISLAVVQSVILYGLEMWVMTPYIGRELVKFQHRVSCSLTGR